MFQHPLIPLIFSLIFLLFTIKQSLTKKVFLRKRLPLAFLLVFTTALILVFRNEILNNEKWLLIVNLYSATIEIIIGIMLVLFTEMSSSKDQLNNYLFDSLDKNKYYFLVDHKNKIKEISTLMLEDLGVSKEKALKKNVFDIIESKYRIFAYNGKDANKDDLKIIFNSRNKDKVSNEMNLEIHDNNGDAHAYYFLSTPVYVFGKYRGRFFVGDKKGTEKLVGMEESLANSINELELIKHRFVTILDKTKEGIFFTNVSDSNIWVNDVIVEGLDLSGNSISLEEYRKNIHPEDLAMVKAKLSQINNINPNYTLSYRYNVGVRYVYVKEEGSRISNGKEIELAGIMTIVASNQYEKTQTDLDSVLGEAEMLAGIKRLYQQDKPFELVYVRVNSIPDINEKYGRAIGSLALSEYIKLLRNKFVDNNMIYRLSGLDFIMVITDYRKMDLLNKVLVNGGKVLNVSADYGAMNVVIKAVMGITSSNEAKDVNQALRNAKKAVNACDNLNNYMHYNKLR